MPTTTMTLHDILTHADQLDERSLNAWLLLELEENRLTLDVYLEYLEITQVRMRSGYLKDCSIDEQDKLKGLKR